MSLQVWLPLNGDLHNQGVSNATVTVVGTTSFANGKIGQGLSCNGSSFWNINPISIGSEASICHWAKTSTGSKMHWVIISTASSILNLYCASIYTLNTGDGNNNPFQDNNGNSISVLTDNQWHHFVVTFGSNVAKLYIDGVYRGKAKTFKNPTTTSAKTIRMAGGFNNAHTYDWNGMINDFRIYNHCLSEKEIKEISKGLILHYPLNRNGWGQDNLILNSSTLFVNKLNNALDSRTEYWAANVNQSYASFVGGEQITLSFDLEMIIRTLPVYLLVYNTNNKGPIKFPFVNVSSQINSLNPSIGDTIKIRVIVPTTMIKRDSPSTTNNFIEFYSNYGSNNFYKITNIKMEMGSKNTPYCPNSSETLYTVMNIGNGIQYDTSGYQNNGTKHNITYDSETPKYDVSSIFISANTSYIKVNQNKWVSQYQEAMTLNFWAYSTDWTNVHRLFSCTETGGWNAQDGDSGYLRFPIYVATNADRTTHTYKYNSKQLKKSDLTAGWHMFTFIYDLTGNKVYIDGQLYSSYAFTSYGIKYNTNARLFLGCEANTASPFSPYLDGKMSDFRMYVTILSDEDILSLYNNGAEIDQLDVIHGQIR